MNLENKNALITGGTKGIGAATALELAKRGANVAVSARHRDGDVDKLLSDIEVMGRKATFVEGDCGKPEDCVRMVDESQSALGGLDVLVHCAGGLVPGGLFEVSDEDWMNGFAVHVHGAFHLSRAVAPLMKQGGEGAIILISSTAGKLAVPTHIGYQTVKGALPQMTRAMARELAPDNIRVNCVAPGVIRTRFHDEMPEEVRTLNLEKRIPLKREGSTDQVASLIAELVQNDYITGDMVTIDGGLTMRIC